MNIEIYFVFLFGSNYSLDLYFKKNIMIFEIFKEFTVGIINLENFKECP
tara:strand:+ start:699 stop:845 length:147 start_codon:yes stop_codon:yes gene_type:complete